MQDPESTARGTTDSAAPAPPVARPLGPIDSSERIHALDVLRGFAIFGIFMVNIGFFSMPLLRGVDRTFMADLPPIDQAASALVRALFEFKFVSLFSLLFGMGMVVQMRRAAARGRRFGPLFLRRTFVLMALGLAHALLLWYGDILFIYSIVALIAFTLRRVSPRGLLIIGVIGVLLATVMSGGFTSLAVIFDEEVEAVDEPPPDAIETPEVAAEEAVCPDGDDRWERFTTALEEDEGDGKRLMEAEIIAYAEGPMLATLVFRAIEYGIVLFAMTISGFGFRILAMFLIGAALMKLDFFAPERRRWHWWFALLGLGIGLPGELALVWTYHVHDYTVGWAEVLVETTHGLSSLALCLGYIGAITLLAGSPALRRVTGVLACVGRLALSNYLLQTLVATTLMYWWGLGWFDTVPPSRQLGLVVIIYAIQLVLSVLWLRVFRIGPFEWLWRSLTYGRVQPWTSR